MVEKSGVEKSGVGKFMVEKSGLERSGVEKSGVEKSEVQMSFNRKWNTPSLRISTHCSSSHRKVRLSDLQYPSPAPALSRKLQGQKIPSKYYWLAGKHMNKVLRWAFMMYHGVDDRALFFFWVPCWLAYLLGGCAASNSNQYFEGVVLFFEPSVLQMDM